MPTSKVTIELLDNIQTAFNRQDVDKILSYFADDCEWLMARGPDTPEGRRCSGKHEIGSVLRDRFKVITDMRWNDMQHWIVDDTKAISKWVVTGSTPGGGDLNYLGCDLWEFRDGMVIKKDTYWKYIDE